MSELFSQEDVKRAWSALVERRLSEALKRYDAIVPRDPRGLYHVNRGVTHLLLGNLDEALADFSQYRNWPGRAKTPVPLVGATLWLHGKPEAACEDWAHEISRRRSGEITHSDEAGGVEVPALLWWASAHSDLKGWRKLADEELKRRWKTKQCQQSRWPGPVAGFLLGKSSDEPLHLITLDRGPFRANERCQAYFYLGASSLDQGDVADYHMRLTQAAGESENSVFTAEYHLACRELAKS